MKEKNGDKFFRGLLLSCHEEKIFGGIHGICYRIKYKSDNKVVYKVCKDGISFTIKIYILRLETIEKARKKINKYFLI